MILAVNSRTGQRHHFSDDASFVAWFSNRRPSSDVLNVASLGLCDDAAAASRTPAAASSGATESSCEVILTPLRREPTPALASAASPSEMSRPSSRIPEGA